MKKYSAILLLIVTTTALSQNDSAALYHPLQIGNEWIFKSVYSSWLYGNPTKNTISSLSRKVIGDTMVNDIRYAVIEENNYKIKQISNFLEQYDSISESFYRLPSAPYSMLDSVYITTPNQYFDRRHMQFIGIGTDTILGKPTISRTIQANVTGVIQRWIFSYGIGPIKEIISDVDYFGGSGLTKTIAYAKINGKEYGNKAILYADSLSQYHPLHNGNIWIYKATIFHYPNPSTVSYLKKEIINDTLMFDKSIGYFYKKVRSQTIGSSSISYEYQRFDTATGNFIRRVNQNGFIEDSTLSSTLSSTFGGSFPNRRLKWIGQDTVLGMFTQVRGITIWNSIAENDQGWSYAYGLGLIGEYISELYPSPITNWGTELVYAKINGKEFGLNPLSVEDEHKAVPVTYSLSQNYPNPFNPSTVIKYQLPANNLVTLKVYDILGREVITLVNDIQEAGYYSVTFNASKLSTGIYIYQLRSKDFVETKKMMLLQ